MMDDITFVDYETTVGLFVYWLIHWFMMLIRLMSYLIFKSNRLSSVVWFQFVYMLWLDSNYATKVDN